LVACATFNYLERYAEPIERLAHLFREPRCHWRRNHPIAATRERASTEARFETPDLLADGALSDRKLPRSGAVASVPRRSFKRAQCEQGRQATHASPIRFAHM
jgi:hypothetical protein